MQHIDWNRFILEKTLNLRRRTDHCPGLSAPICCRNVSALLRGFSVTSVSQHFLHLPQLDLGRSCLPKAQCCFCHTCSSALQGDEKTKHGGEGKKPKRTQGEQMTWRPPSVTVPVRKAVHWCHLVGPEPPPCQRGWAHSTEVQPPRLKVWVSF